MYNMNLVVLERTTLYIRIGYVVMIFIRTPSTDIKFENTVGGCSQVSLHFAVYSSIKHFV